MAKEKDISRRIILANSLVGLGTLAVGSVGCGSDPMPTSERNSPGRAASPINGVQGGWRFCSKCAVLFFIGNGSGTCPAGGGHDASSSGQYVMVFDAPTYPGSSGWRWCWKCEGLAFMGDEDWGGLCPAGSSHEGDQSALYTVATSGGQFVQSGWDFCMQCAALYYRSATNRACPEIGNHVAGNYAFFVDYINA